MVPRLKTNKNCDLHLRVPDQLKIYVANKAAEQNKTINDYCINILRNIDYANKLGALEQMQRQKIKLLSNIANNLNQLSKHCNTTKTAPQKEILLEIFNEIKTIK